MPRPDDPVVINHDLWDAVRDGVVVSEDLSPSLRLRESMSSTLPTRVRALPLQPLPARDWRAESARLRAGLPFARQLTPPPSSGSPSTGPPSRSDDSENVELNILRAELSNIEQARADDKDLATRRERALFKVVEGFCEYHRAVAQR